MTSSPRHESPARSWRWLSLALLSGCLSLLSGCGEESSIAAPGSRSESKNFRAQASAALCPSEGEARELTSRLGRALRLPGQANEDLARRVLTEVQSLLPEFESYFTRLVATASALSPPERVA
jgi:hypothetical protein